MEKKAYTGVCVFTVRIRSLEVAQEDKIFDRNFTVGPNRFYDNTPSFCSSTCKYRGYTCGPLFKQRLPVLNHFYQQVSNLQEPFEFDFCGGN